MTLYKLYMNSILSSKCSKIMRDRTQFIKLLLRTIQNINFCKQFGDHDIDENQSFLIALGKSNSQKYNRIFFKENSNKIFSINFPFKIEEISDSKEVANYLNITDENYISKIKLPYYKICINIDQEDIPIDETRIAKLLSIFSLFETNSQMSNEDVLESLYDVFGDDKYDNDNLWYIFLKLITLDLGYLRYDDDLEHEKEGYHPRHHLDVNYSDDVTYKIGLKRELPQIQDLLDILDNSQIRKMLD